MKRHTMRRWLLLTMGVGVGLAAGAEGRGDSKPGRDSTARRERGLSDIRLAAQTGERRLGDYLNRSVFGIAGTRIGAVADFLLDRLSGRVAYVIVLVPDAPLDARRRLLRADALRWQPARESFEVQTALDLPADESQRVLERDTFVRATSLPGQPVRNGDITLGRFADVVVDFEKRTAAPVLATSPAILKSPRTFVVSLSRFRVGEGNMNAATTTVTPEDLARVELAATPIAADGSLPASRITGASGIAQSSVSGQTGYSSPQTANAATTEATDAGVIDESANPAGRLEDRPVPEAPGAPPVMITPAESPREADARLKAQIERALAADARLLGEDIAVSVERGVVTLRGTVGTTLKRDAAVAIARAAGARVVKSDLAAGPPR